MTTESVRIIPGTIFECSDSYTREYWIGGFLMIRVDTFRILGPVDGKPIKHAIGIACNSRTIHMTLDYSKAHATLAEAKAELETLLPGVLERTKKAVELLLAPVKLP